MMEDGACSGGIGETDVTKGIQTACEERGT